MDILIKRAPDIENNISHINNLVTSIAPNSKATERENKTLDITGLVTASYLNTKSKEIENKIPGISGLINKINIGFVGWNNDFLYVNKVKMHQFKSKDCRINMFV